MASDFHHFNVELARLFGVDGAIMIQGFRRWIEKNRAEADQEHYVEGHWWTYNSYEGLCKLFRYWTPKQVRTVVDGLVGKGVLIRKQVKKSTGDHRNWYAFADEERFLSPPEQPSGLPKRADDTPHHQPSGLPKRANHDRTKRADHGTGTSYNESPQQVQSTVPSIAAALVEQEPTGVKKALTDLFGDPLQPEGKPQKALKPDVVMTNERKREFIAALGPDFEAQMEQTDWPKEWSAAKTLTERGYPPEVVAAFWHEHKRQPRWRSQKLSLTFVQANIKAWMASKGGRQQQTVTPESFTQYDPGKHQPTEYDLYLQSLPEEVTRKWFEDLQPRKETR